MVEFTDDVAVITTGRTTHILEEVTNRVLEVVPDWMEDNDLELSVQKTEAIVLTNKRGFLRLNFMMNEFCIQPQE